MRYDKLLIVDLEATCWETREESAKNTSEIIEIGIVRLDLNTGKIEKSEGIIVQPYFSKVSPFCTKLTTLTQADVDKGITFDKAYDKLVDEYDSKNTPWTSFGAYDKKMLERQSQAWEAQSPMSEHHVNVKLLIALLSKNHKAVGMERVLKDLNIPLVGTHHRGIDDALNITKIFQRIVLK